MSDASQGLATEISNSIAVVWKNHCGTRPAQPRTEINSDVIRCMLDGAVADFDAGVAAQADVEPAAERPPTEATYRLDAIAAIGRVTRRRVLAFVSDHDAKTNLATEVFILDRPVGRPGRDFPDHRRAATGRDES